MPALGKLEPVAPADNFRGRQATVFAVTHKHEKRLRAKSMTLIHADVELSRRLLVIEKAMTVIFGYTIEHTSRSENEATI